MSANNKKRALGRGLSALLENAETDITTKSGEITRNVAGSVSEIAIEQIETNPFQPRTHFEEEALQELADSIKLQGIIQPITVRKMGYDRFQLISGERRFRASQIAGLTRIPAYIRIANDQAMLELALLENIQRENLDAIEIAISYKRLLEECSLTQEQLSEKMSKQRSTITNYLRLLKLPAEIQLGIRDKHISMGHARTLINIEDKELQLAIFNAVIEQDLSVRQVEDMVRAYNNGDDVLPKTGKKSAPSVKTPSFEDKQLMKQLHELFATKVELKRKANGAGKIVIEFSNNDEFEKVMNVLSIN